MQKATHQNSWYPVGQQLVSMLDKAFSDVPMEIEVRGTTKAIVVPHAGYVYSVSTAAHAFKALTPPYLNALLSLGHPIAYMLTIVQLQMQKASRPLLVTFYLTPITLKIYYRITVIYSKSWSDRLPKKSTPLRWNVHY